MLRKIIFVFSFLLICSNAFAQAPDATVIIHENMLNAFLDAVGPVSGTNHFNMLGIKGDYRWTLSNARIEVKRDHATFTADANIRVGPF